MKKLFIIQTQDILDPNKYGFIRLGTDPGANQIKLFRSRYACRRFLRKNRKDLRMGIAHIIIPIFVK